MGFLLSTQDVIKLKDIIRKVERGALTVSSPQRIGKIGTGGSGGSYTGFFKTRKDTEKPTQVIIDYGVISADEITIETTTDELDGFSNGTNYIIFNLDYDPPEYDNDGIITSELFIDEDYSYTVEQAIPEYVEGIFQCVIAEVEYENDKVKSIIQHQHGEVFAILVDYYNAINDAQQAAQKKANENAKALDDQLARNGDFENTDWNKIRETGVVGVYTIPSTSETGITTTALPAGNINISYLAGGMRDNATAPWNQYAFDLGFGGNRFYLETENSAMAWFTDAGFDVQTEAEGASIGLTYGVSVADNDTLNIKLKDQEGAYANNEGTITVKVGWGDGQSFLSNGSLMFEVEASPLTPICTPVNLTTKNITNYAQSSKSCNITGDVIGNFFVSSNSFSGYVINVCSAEFGSYDQTFTLEAGETASITLVSEFGGLLEGNCFWQLS